jgi:hypothetical protein
VVTCARNFFAHRNHHTRVEVESNLSAKFAIVASGHVTEVLLAVHHGGSSLLETWLWNYLDVAELLCEK